MRSSHRTPRRAAVSVYDVANMRPRNITGPTPLGVDLPVADKMSRDTVSISQNAANAPGITDRPVFTIRKPIARQPTPCVTGLLSRIPTIAVLAKAARAVDAANPNHPHVKPKARPKVTFAANERVPA